MPSVIVVGAGLSGVAAARTLTGAGLSVRVLDRGHRVGGRMASRRIDDRVADLGASYLTVSEPEFEAVVRDWQDRGLARPWTDTFVAWEAGALTEKTGPVRLAAPGGLRSLVEDLATGLEIERRTVGQVGRVETGGGPGAGVLVDGESADAVVLAMPDPQARRLLDASAADLAPQLDDPFEPALALTARWAERTWGDVDGVFVGDHPALSWIADDGRRRGDSAPVLVAHSTPELARDHLDHPDQAVDPMVAAVREVLAIRPQPVSATVHRWTFAKPTGRRRQPFLLTDARIGVCGDAWSDRPRVEAAYGSGVALARALLERLG